VIDSGDGGGGVDSRTLLRIVLLIIAFKVILVGESLTAGF